MVIQKRQKRFLFFLCSLITALGWGQSNGSEISGSVDFIYYQNLGQPIESKWTLTFEGNKSLFISSSDVSYLNKKTSGSNTQTFELKVNKKLTPHIIHDFTKDSIYSQGLVFKDPYYIKDEISNPKWEIHSEKKVISGFSSQRATTTFRGRTYEVWFTSEIPVKFGPWKLNGLPGLILIATDSKGQIEFRATKINFGNENKQVLDSQIASIPKLGKELNLRSYIDKKDNEGDEISKYISSKLSRGGSSNSTFESAGRNNKIEISYEWEN